MVEEPVASARQSLWVEVFSRKIIAGPDSLKTSLLLVGEANLMLMRLTVEVNMEVSEIRPQLKAVVAIA